jgi:hypothetical protein
MSLDEAKVLVVSGLKTLEAVSRGIGGAGVRSDAGQAFRIVLKAAREPEDTDALGRLHQARKLAVELRDLPQSESRPWTANELNLLVRLLDAIGVAPSH